MPRSLLDPVHGPAAIEPRPGGRLLLISYHFPPGQASGALRWQKLARYAARRGWGLDVVSLHPVDLPSEDRTRLGDLPADTRIWGVRRPRLPIERLERWTWLAYRALLPRPGTMRPPNGGRTGEQARASTGRYTTRARPLATIHRAYAAWLDYAWGLRWARDAANVATRLVERHGHAAVITCGPPHMAHEAGRIVAQRARRPLVIDLRDPWSLVERLASELDSPVWHRLAKRYEGPVVANAALVVMNTAAAANAMQRAYPDAAHRVITVMNGYDDVVGGSTAPPVAGAPFTVVFAGSVYIDRDPGLLVRAAASVIRHLSLGPNEFRVQFIGNVDASIIADIAQREGVEPFVSVMGFRPRSELDVLLRQAQVLVSLNQDSELAIPAKIFEYLQYHAWLLAIAEPDSATEVALRGTGADVVSATNGDAIATALETRYLEHRQGQRPPRLAASAPHLSRRHQADVLFDAIANIIANRATHPVAVAAASGG